MDRRAFLATPFLLATGGCPPRLQPATVTIGPPTITVPPRSTAEAVAKAVAEALRANTAGLAREIARVRA